MVSLTTPLIKRLAGGARNTIRGLRAIFYVWRLYLKFYKIDAIAYLFFEFLDRMYTVFVLLGVAEVIDSLVLYMTSGAGIGYGSTKVVWAVAQLVAIWLIPVFTRTFGGYYKRKIALKKEAFLMEVLLKKKLQLSTQQLEDPEIAGILEQITSNTWRLGEAFSTVTSSILDFFVAILTLVILAKYGLVYPAIVFVLAILAGVEHLYFGGAIWSIWESNTQERIKYVSYMMPLREVSPVIQAQLHIFGGDKFLFGRARDILNKFLNKLLKKEHKRLFVQTIRELANVLVWALLIIHLAKQVSSKGLSIGSFYKIFELIRVTKQYLIESLTAISGLLGSAGFYLQFVRFMTIRPVIKSGRVKISPSAEVHNARVRTRKERLGVRIQVQDVWFKYPGTQKYILKGVSLDIEPSQNVAIVGVNGAGKTTLLKLILRLYDPDKGRILINGMDLKNINLHDYYKAIGYLGQTFLKPQIMVKENIAFRRRFDMEGVINAAKRAKAHRFIEKLPEKYNTWLTRALPNGATLSGGQWQRLAIARAFFKDPALLILDEPTSAVDALAEKRIFENIFKTAKKATTIIVSHRFSTVQLAEKIFVLDGGAIVEQGTHEQLLKHSGLYKQMYTAQVG